MVSGSLLLVIWGVVVDFSFISFLWGFVAYFEMLGGQNL